MLAQLPDYQRGPVSDFLVAYMKQTKKIVTTLPMFISNIMRAHSAGKFGLRSVLTYFTPVTSNNSTPKEDELRPEEIAALERVAKAGPARPEFRVPARGSGDRDRGKRNAVGRVTRSSQRVVSPEAKRTDSKKKTLAPKTTPKKPVRSKQLSEAPKEHRGKAHTTEKKKLPSCDSPSAKYAKLAQRKLVAKAAPKSSYERPTQAYMLRSRLNQFLSKKQSLCTKKEESTVPEHVLSPVESPEKVAPPTKGFPLAAFLLSRSKRISARGAAAES